LLAPFSNAHKHSFIRSAFMKEYRAIKQQLDDVGAHVWTIPKVKDWMRAQQLAKDRLSETRQHYMDTLRSDWRTWEP
jgi:2-keto-3-deoxy-L-rhamnonate aldolase RhmA